MLDKDELITSLPLKLHPLFYVKICKFNIGTFK